MKTAYDSEKISLAEPSLKGNIVPDAKRPDNFTSLSWRAQPDSVWGHLLYSLVLQQTGTEIVFAKTCLFSSMFQLFSSRIIQRVYLQKDSGSYHPKWQKGEAIINFHHFAKFLNSGMPEFPVF